MASKFWNAATSESSSESSSSSGSDNEGPSSQLRPTAQPVKKPMDWAAMSDSSSEDNSKRVVKTEKNKRWDALRAVVQKLKQHQKTHDYAEVEEDFAALVKTLTKSQKVIESEGAPNFLIRALVDLQRYVEDRHADKAAMKKCSKQKSTAINRLTREIPKKVLDFKMAMTECRENPADFESEDDASSSDESASSSSSSSKSSSSSSDDDNSEEGSGSDDSSSSEGSDSEDSSSKESDSDTDSDSESSSDEDSEEESSEGAKKATRKKAALKTGKKKGSSSESDSDSESVSSSSSSASKTSHYSRASSQEGGDLDWEALHQRAIRRWGYRNKVSKTPEEKKLEKHAAAQKRRDEMERRKLAKDKLKEEFEASGSAVVSTVRRGSALLPDGGEHLDEKSIMAKTHETISVRGKRGAERQEQLEILQQLAQLAKRKGFHQVHLEILHHSVTLQLDVTHMASGYPSVASWDQVFNEIFDLFCLLLTNNKVTLTLSSPEGAVDATGVAAPTVIHTSGMILSFVERLDDCLHRSFQGTETHSKAYRDRLVQLCDLQALLWLSWVYYCENNAPAEMFRTAARIAEHNYYLPDRIASARWKIVAEKIPATILATFKENYPLPIEQPSDYLQKICKLVISQAPVAESRLRFRASAFAVYNLALQCDFHAARDALQFGNLYEHATSLDVGEHILYNRCLAQVGLAAFRLGDVSGAAIALAEVCGSSKQRELLAQGVAVVKGFDKTAEQERAERRRLLPAHMHLNLDVVESAHTISVMLVEVPHLTAAAHGADGRYRMSRFKRALEAFEKSSSPPESSREFVAAAAKRLQNGDWRGAQELIENMKFWDYFSPSEEVPKIKDMLLMKMKEVALQCYIVSNSGVYKSISIDQLGALFELSSHCVHGIIAKMIVKKELPAFWDAESQVVVLHQTTTTELEAAATKLVDNIAVTLEQNESLYTQRFGTGLPQEKNQKKLHQRPRPRYNNDDNN